MSLFSSLVSSVMHLFIVAAVSLLFTAAVQAQSYSETGVCFIFYGAKGTVDYPWAVSLFLDIEYDTQLQSNSNGDYYEVVDGMAYYAYHNKSGVTTVSSSQELDSGNLYINSALPVDSTGLTFLLAPNTRFPFRSFQLPGVGPKQSFGYSTVSASTADQSSPYVQLGEAFTLDTASQAWVSSLPGFVNRTIASSNVNALAVDYNACTATINANNGQVAAVTPSPSNTATQFSYSYVITDGTTYSVSADLTITTSASPLISVDQLGNSYQNVTAITGTRVYTYLPTGATVTSTITGMNSGLGTPSQRWYPFTLLESSAGVYNSNTAPYLDGDGLSFHISPTAPVNGYAPDSNPQYNTIVVQVSASSPVGEAVLTELETYGEPVLSSQQQTYTL